MAVVSEPPAPTSREAAVRVATQHDGLALAGLSRRLGRLSVPSATAVLVAIAIVGALALHWLLGFIPGLEPDAGLYISASIVTILVATPIVAYAQNLIRSLRDSRRVLKRMTERLAVALDEAERASQAKSGFVANMSHELRTPLNAIIGFSDLIRNATLGPVGNARYLDYARDIHDSGAHLLGIINEILDLAKIESGRAPPEKPAPFALVPMLEQAVRVTAPLAQKQDVAVSVDIAAEHRNIELLAVERMVRQIVLNILSNAVKFTPGGGSVQLSLDLSDSGLAVRIADTGIGMTAEDIKVALTPFGQVDNALTRQHAGTGLGLPLAKAMMELAHGELAIKSAPGRGTTVAMIFPGNAVMPKAPSLAAAC
ncbi:MAG TPA: HAMP domain-containing sensor histidine kinase [Stellaceae bacterium]|nr:HAMP domain-containing sensor histidine kinase [Stellaceae bacterium]